MSAPVVRPVPGEMAKRPPGTGDKQWRAYELWCEGGTFQEVAEELGLGNETIRTYVRRVRLAAGLVAFGVREMERGSEPREEKGAFRVTGNCRCGLRLYGDDRSCGDCLTLERATYLGGVSQGALAIRDGGTSHFQATGSEKREGLGGLLRGLNGGRKMSGW